MSRTVECILLKKEGEGLDFAPYPGEHGLVPEPHLPGFLADAVVYALTKLARVGGEIETTDPGSRFPFRLLSIFCIALWIDGLPASTLISVPPRLTTHSTTSRRTKAAFSHSKRGK